METREKSILTGRMQKVLISELSGNREPWIPVSSFQGFISLPFLLTPRFMIYLLDKVGSIEKWKSMLHHSSLHTPQASEKSMFLLSLEMSPLLVIFEGAQQGNSDLKNILEQKHSFKWVKNLSFFLQTDH